ncbi:est [Symbiodinium pilosum]|uniref:Est protein n=1 Tax=Symbiodinium pilosum TaxID=2952 RepID=A0A812P0C0_SYMPI|nr:est [Symbiodinium pilosum]
MTDLLVDHSRFTNGKFDGGFDQHGFLAKCSEPERPFLKELTSTQMWAGWISRRLASGEDSKDIVLFDEVIAQKLNRKTFTLSKTATPFLSLDFSEKGHYREVRVQDPPRGSVQA